MKHPPIQMDDREARQLIDDFLGIRVDEAADSLVVA
jgi:hypothetical protein